MKNKKCNQMLAILMAITMGCTSIPTTAFATELPATTTVSEEASTGEEQKAEASTTAIEASTEEVTTSAEAVTEETTKQKARSAAPAAVDTEEATKEAEEATTEEEAPPAEETEDLVYDTSWYNEEDTEFTLTDAFDLVGLALLVKEGNNFAGKTIKLGNNVDAGGVKWLPIGWTTYDTLERNAMFNGTFDGQGYTLSNVVVKTVASDPNQSLGVFGKVGISAVIENLHVTDSKITVTKVSNYSNRGHGGIVGVNQGIIRNCSYEGSITADMELKCQIGGIAGTSTGTIEHCTFHGNVKNNSGTGNITNDYNNKVITGGIAGTGSKIYYCTVEEGSVIRSRADSLGGIVGKIGGTVQGCENQGDVILGDPYYTGNYVAGIAGSNNGTAILRGNINTGRVVSEANKTTTLGGITAGTATVSYCVNRGKISNEGDGNANIYGIASGGTLNSCYTTCGAMKTGTMVNCYGAEEDKIEDISGVTFLPEAAYSNSILLLGLNETSPIWEEGEDGYPVVKKTAILSITMTPTGMLSSSTFTYDSENKMYVTSIPGIDFKTVKQDNFKVNLLYEDSKVKVSAGDKDGKTWIVTVTNGSASDQYKLSLDATMDLSWYSETAKDLYISNAAQIEGFSYLGAKEGKTFEGQTIHLTSDIDMKGVAWQTITTFKGNFNGENHTLKNFEMRYEAASTSERVSKYLSMFNNATDAVIENFSIEDFHGVLKAYGGSINLIARTVKNSTIQNIHVNGVTYELEKTNSSGDGPKVDGALVYQGTGITMKDCSISGGDIPGVGILFTASSGTNLLENCVNEADAQGYGIARSITGTIRNCVNKGNITDSTDRNVPYRAGLCGDLSGVMENCRNEGDVTTSTKSYAAGLVAVFHNSIEGTKKMVNCSNSGNITNNYSSGTAAGIIVTNNNSECDIINCYNTGAITANSGTAIAIAGAAYAAKVNVCFNTGTLTGKNIYGIVKGANNVVQNAYTVTAGTMDGASYDCVFVQKQEEEEIAIEGVSTFEASDLKDGKLKDALNAIGMVQWKQGEDYPTPMQASIIGGTLKIENYKEKFELFWKDNAIHVKVPTVDIAQFAGNDFEITCLDPETEVTYSYDAEDKVGKMTVTLGDDSISYQVIYDILEDSAWYTPTETNFTLTTVGQMKALLALVNDMGETMEGKTIALGNDLDFSGVKGWSGIGNAETPFMGTFDGEGHSISNWEDTVTDYYWVTREEEWTQTSKNGGYIQPGLFGMVDSGTVKDLTLKKANLSFEATQANTDAGAFISYLHNGKAEDLKLDQDSVVSSKTGYAGGILGCLGGTAINCINEATVTGGGRSAGIAATMTVGKISGCTNKGKIISNTSSTTGIGGVVGYVGNQATDAENTVRVENCTNEGDITNNSTKSGGIIGSIGRINPVPVVVECTNTGKIEAKNGCAGGIVGDSNKKITCSFCRNLGDVEAKNEAAGIVAGSGSYAYTFDFCYNQGKITGGNSYVGGICGNISDSIYNHCYSVCYDSDSKEFSDSSICGIGGKGNTYVNTYYYSQKDGSDVSGLYVVKDAKEFTDGTLTKKMNAQWSAWKQGTAGPEFADYILKEIAVTKDGQTFVASIVDGKIKVQMPMADMTAFKEDNFVIDKRDADTAVTYTYDKDKKCWTLEAKKGEESGTYDIYFDFLETGWYDADKDFYKISNKEELLGLQYLVNKAGVTFEGKTILLDADIDMKGLTWDGIGVYTASGVSGTVTTPFMGTFDGANHVVSNLTGEMPLFQVVESGTVKNLKVKDIAIDNTGDSKQQSAAVVRYAKNAVLENITAEGTLKTARQYNGMLSAVVYDTTVKDCHVTADVTCTSNRYTAGLIGYANHATITDSSYDGTVTSTGNCSAGIVAWTANETYIQNCKVGTNKESAIQSKQRVGGIIGYMQGESTIEDCTVKASAKTTDSNYAGGMVGYANTSLVLRNCVNEGDVTSSKTAGGMVGYFAGNKSAMYYCVNRGNIMGTTGASGLIGECKVTAETPVVSSYSTGTLTAGASGKTSGLNAKGSGKLVFKDSILVEGKLPTENSLVTYENYYALKDLDPAAKKTDGVTVYSQLAFEDGTVLDKLNVVSPVWTQGEKYPELSELAITGVTISLDGSEKDYEAVVNKTKDTTCHTFEVVLPIGTKAEKLTKDNADILTVHGNAKVDVAISSDGHTWTLTTKNGTKTDTYKLLVQVADQVDVPMFTKNLTGGNYYTSEDVEKSRIQYMNVGAVVYDGGNLSYQWYENTKASNQGGTAIAGETKPIFQPTLTDKDGKAMFGRRWYYCVVTNTIENEGQKYQSSNASALREVNLQCTVTIVDEAGINDGDMYVNYGKRLSDIPLEKNPGYDVCWYSDEAMTDKLSDTTKIKDDGTFYVGWEDSTYTVTVPDSTEDYEVAVDTDSSVSVKDGDSFGFTVTPKVDSILQLIVKVNDEVLTADSEAGTHYVIEKIQKDQKIVIECTKGVTPDEEGIYQVSNEAELIAVLSDENNAGASIALTKDIVLSSGTTFFTTQEKAFKGTMDGKGHALTNMKSPFIGWVAKEGKVKNLTFEGAFEKNISLSFAGNTFIYPSSTVGYQNYYSGPIAVNEGNVERCESTVQIDVTNFVNAGGIVGYNFGTVTNCIFGKEGSIGTRIAGGIAGLNDGTITTCYSLGYVSGDSAGGIVGMNSPQTEHATIENCYAAGSVDGTMPSWGTSTRQFGAIIGRCRPDGTAAERLENVKNNYYKSGTVINNANGTEYAYNNKKTTEEGKMDVVTDKKMKSVFAVSNLNSTSREAIYLADTKNQNDGYPILVWQGTPRATEANVTLGVDGKLQADMIVKAVVTTELKDDYSIDWLTETEGVYTTISSGENSVQLTKKMIGTNLYVRYNSLEDGSTVLSKSFGKIEASPIKSIGIDLTEADTTEGNVDLIYDSSNAERGKLVVGLQVEEAESAYLADGQTVTWTTDNRSVIKINDAKVTYKHDADKPGAATIEAVGTGTATLTATMDGMTATVTVVVRPAVVDEITVQKPDGDTNTTTESGAMAGDLAKTYGWDMGTNSKTYVTALHLFAKEMVDSGKVTKEDVKVTNGVLISVNGQDGTWYYTLNGEYMGAIDATKEIKSGDQVRFIFVPTQNGSEGTPVTKMAMFDQIVYNAFETVQTAITLTEANVNGEGTQSPAAGATITVTDNAGNPVKAIVTESGKVESITTNTTGKVNVSFETEGTYHIKATRDGMMEATADIVIAKKIKVAAITATPSKIDLKTGQTADIKATVKPDNATIKVVSFESENDDVATVDATGKVTAKGPGITVITVTSVDQPDVKAEVKVTVTQPVKEIKTDATATVVAGNSIQLNPTVLPANASNKAVSYVSKTPGIATVDSNGKVLGVSEGTVTIEIVAKDGSGVKASVVVTVKAPVYKVTGITLNAKTASVKVKSTYQIQANVAPSNATDKKVTYTSSNPAIAAVDANGKVMAKKVGTTEITVKAADGSGVTATMKVTVTAPKITLNTGNTTIPLQVKKSTTAVKIKTTDVQGEKIVKATSSKTSIATAAVKKGVLTIKAKKAGTVTITVQTTNGGKAAVKVKVQKGKVTTKKLSLNKTKVTLKVKGKHTITVTRNPITATEKITYSNSNKKVATVTGKGVITAKKAGKAVITVKTANGKKATVTVTVKKK